MSMTQTETPSHSGLTMAMNTEVFQAQTGSTGTLFCKNITPLPIAAFQIADQLLMAMMAALLDESVETFNTAKRQLVVLLKKHGEPITQWNPLVLELTDAECLQGKQLSNINLEMVSLRSTEGPVVLNGTCLQGAAMLCADLSHACFNNTELSGADLRFASLIETNLQQAILIETNLSYANLSGADLEQANLYRAKLNGAIVKQANLKESNLRKADLRNADFYQANFQQARLQHADLRESNLFMADLAQSRLRYSDLRNANLGFSRLIEARLQNARLCDANLSSADLTRADLRNCRLNGVDLNRAIVKDANLSAAQLAESDLADCQALESANWANAVFDKETSFPENFQPKNHGLNNLQFLGFRRISRLISSLLN